MYLITCCEDVSDVLFRFRRLGPDHQSSLCGTMCFSFDKYVRYFFPYIIEIIFTSIKLTLSNNFFRSTPRPLPLIFLPNVIKWCTV